MDMKRLFIALFSLLIVCNAFSQNSKTFNDIKEEFRKQKVFALDVDLMILIYQANSGLKAQYLLAQGNALGKKRK